MYIFLRWYLRQTSGRAVNWDLEYWNYKNYLPSMNYNSNSLKFVCVCVYVCVCVCACVCLCVCAWVSSLPFAVICVVFIKLDLLVFTIFLIPIPCFFLLGFAIFKVILIVFFLRSFYFLVNRVPKFVVNTV